MQNGKPEVIASIRLSDGIQVNVLDFGAREVGPNRLGFSGKQEARDGRAGSAIPLNEIQGSKEVGFPQPPQLQGVEVGHGSLIDRQGGRVVAALSHRQQAYFRRGQCPAFGAHPEEVTTLGCHVQFGAFWNVDDDDGLPVNRNDLGLDDNGWHGPIEEDALQRFRVILGAAGDGTIILNADEHQPALRSRS